MALNFSAGSTQKVDVGTTGAGRNVPGVTLTAWIRPTTLSAGRHIVFGFSNGTATGTTRAKIGHFGLNIEGSGRVLDANTFQAFAAGTLTTGIWSHIAARLDYVARTITLFHNGVVVGTSGVLTGWTSGNSSDTDSLACSIASQHGGTTELFDGMIDDARAYGRLLSDDEIQTIYITRGADGIVTGLQHRFLMKEGAPGAAAVGAGTIINFGSLGNNGTPLNNPTYVESTLRFRRKLAG